MPAWPLHPLESFYVTLFMSVKQGTMQNDYSAAMTQYNKDASAARGAADGMLSLPPIADAL